MSTLLHNTHKEVDGLSLYFIGDIAVIVMDRGENRINSTLINAFNLLLDEVESNVSCKGLITTGKGKFFSNGLDLDLMAAISEGEIMMINSGLLVLLKRLIFFPLPTVAAINGHAFAGGALIACAHDLRTMNSERGWLCFNEVFINRRFGNFNLIYLEEKLGKGRNLNDALVLGKRFTAQEGRSCGVIQSIQPHQLLIQESLKVLKSFYGKGYNRDSMRAMKEDVYRESLAFYENEQIEQDFESLKSSRVSSKL